MNKEPITRLKMCKFCKCMTPQTLTQIGVTKFYFIVKCECPNCTYSANTFLTEKEWEDLQGQQVLPSN
jgi:hypothetical protein